MGLNAERAKTPNFSWFVKPYFQPKVEEKKLFSKSNSAGTITPVDNYKQEDINRFDATASIGMKKSYMGSEPKGYIAYYIAMQITGQQSQN